MLYQLGLFRDGVPHPAAPGRLDRVGVLFSLSSLVNVAWILAWHHDLIGLSALLLVALLVLLVLITRATRHVGHTTTERAFVRLPFSVYFGWITVATIANITVWLVSIGWDGLGIAEPVWAAVIIAVGTVIGATVVLRDRDVAYGLVPVWAYLGIWLKHTSASGFDGAYPLVSTTALAGIAVFLAACAVVLVRGRRRAHSAPGLTNPDS